MVTFIVPIYNAAGFLDACIDSLSRQTEQDVQIILVDDGSTDGSLEIAQAHAKQDSRVEVYRQDNAGQSVARNMGMTHAKGEFIAFVDADDALEPDWCERHLAAIGNVDYVQSGYKRVESGKSKVESGKSKVESQKTPCHLWQFSSPCMRLYRREAIEGMQFMKGMIYEDVIWSVDLWMRHLTCRIIDYPGYLYTLNPDSTTAHSHPEARQALFRTLRDKLRNAFGKDQIIILYTLLRLKLHFLIH